jgi:tetratricopeptide (TPR) repeat protein
MSALDRESLEIERDFLLRSLDDLEAERAVGNVDDGTYRELHDDYTARAAAVIRSLDADTDLTVPDRPPASNLARALTVTGVVTFAIVAAFVLAHAIGQRHPGQTITGNNQVASGPTAPGVDPGPALTAAAREHPRSFAARIAYARYLLATRDFGDAVLQFGAAARIDPSRPEPPAYAAWAGALVAQQVPDATTHRSLLSASLERLNEVISSHPKYPDAYALKGVILFDFEQDARHAVPSFQRFLLLTDEANPLRSQVLDFLAQAEKAARGS